ncbi:YeaC family protein [Spongorhabdus nitratireducens]
MTTDFRTTVETMSADVYASLKRAVELGKWPNGERLKPEQVGLCLQTVIAWEQIHAPEEQRTGYMAQTCQSSKEDEQEKDESSILRFEV